MIDMMGKKFGRLEVVECAEKNKYGSYAWKCKCECGGEIIVDGRSLRRGLTKSCGCLNNDVRKSGNNRRTHGQCGTRLYRIWKAMKNRCLNENTKDYKRWYGSTGVTICDEWKNSFMPFYEWAMENGYADDLSIDRIDPCGNYDPSNCRWATPTEQAQNKRKKKEVVLGEET